jgi:hypothetical protein
MPMTGDERDALAGLAKTVAARHILLAIKSIGYRSYHIAGKIHSLRH